MQDGRDSGIPRPVCLNGERIKDLTCPELQRENIITLEEFFNKIDINKIMFFLDIKGSTDIIISLIELLKDSFTPTQLERVYISGFNRHFVQSLKNSKLPVKIGFTTGNNFTAEQLIFLTEGLQFVCIHWTSLDARNIEAMRDRDIEVFSYTCGNNLTLEHMRTFSLDGIVTDYPILENLT